MDPRTLWIITLILAILSTALVAITERHPDPPATLDVITILTTAAAIATLVAAIITGLDTALT